MMAIPVASRQAVAVAVYARRRKAAMQLPARPSSAVTASSGPGVYPPCSW
jgi:hypothetical protein